MFFMIFFDNVRQSVATVMVESTFVWHAPYTGDIFRRADCSAVVLRPSVFVTDTSDKNWKPHSHLSDCRSSPQVPSRRLFLSHYFWRALPGNNVFKPLHLMTRRP